MKLNFILISILIIFQIDCLTQNGEWKWYFPQFNDLPSSYVNCTTIDSNGNLWVGTKKGLGIFDGFNWIQYQSNNSDLPGNNVTCLVTSVDGSIWVGTESNGLANYKNGNWKVYNTNNSEILSDSIKTLVSDDSATIWIGFFYQSPIMKFDSIDWERYDGYFYNGEQQNCVQDITIDNNGYIWIAAGYGGFARLNGKTWEKEIITDNKGRNSNILSIAIENDNAIWVGSEDDGVFLYRNHQLLQYNCTDTDEIFLYVYDIEKDNGGILWLGTVSGLYSFDHISWTSFHPSNSGLPAEYVNDVTIDNVGRKYVSTGSGLALYYDNDWIVYSASYGIPDYHINDVEVIQDTIWMATESGVAKYYNGNWETYNNNNSELRGNSVAAIEVAPDGTLWIGNTEGLFSFDGTEWKFYPSSDPHSLNSAIITIAIESDGTVWVGTITEGVWSLKDGTWTVFNECNSNNIQDITIDEKGNKWIGTGEGGLARYDNESWTIWNAANSDLPDSPIHCIAIDQYGKKWIGTEKGIAIFDDVSFQLMNISNSNIYSNSIWAITFDKDGNAWIGHYWSNGLSKFDGTTFTHFQPELKPYYTNGITVLDLEINDYGDLVLGTSQSGMYLFNENYLVGMNTEKTENFPTKLSLNQNYPNPSNGETIIQFGIERTSDIALFIYDCLGRLVKKMDLGHVNSGIHQVKLSTAKMTSGVYLYSISNGSELITKKMIILK